MVRSLERAGGTDALRRADGYGDAMHGVEIDNFAGRWLVLLPEEGILLTQRRKGRKEMQGGSEQIFGAV
jgi:hypothetical protein